MLRATWPLLLGAALTLACAANTDRGPAGGATPTSTPSTPSGPTGVGSEARLSLSADLADGGRRAYRFVAEISGGRTDDSSLYCQPTTWGFGDGPALAVTPSCAPWTAGITVPTRFESSHTYSAAGQYVVTFEYGSLTARTSIDVR